MDKEKAARQYYIPGEAILQIRHSPVSVDTVNILGAVESFLKPSDPKKPLTSDWNLRLELPERRKVMTVPSKNEKGQIFSLVPVRLPEHHYYDFSQDDVSEVLSDASKDFKEKRTIPIPEHPEFEIHSLSPNWLINTLHHGSSTGGPGGWPYRADEPSAEKWEFEVTPPIDNLVEYKDRLTGTEFHVAILDTAPSRHDLDRAYHDRPNHPLVQALFGPDSNLDVKYASPATMGQLMHYSPDSHHYWMADHGTFIAGIIHTLAPDAKLHLYEVLSPYGVGSFESVAQGILDAIAGRGNAGYPLIINCSFMFSTPVKGVKDLDSPIDLTDGEMESIKMSMKELFGWITDEVTNLVLVAAAGNDANNNSNSANRPDARFPASFRNVVGVGGLPKDFRKEADDPGKYKPATYSNLSDAPPRTGFMTLGGEPEPPDQGVLGMFISDFPIHNPAAAVPDEVSYEPNTTGWARWAGTSFAAPVITGLLANFPTIPQTSSSRNTKENEKVIEVRQKIDDP